MSDIDWSKAPEGATHWGPPNADFPEWWYRFECVDGRAHWNYWREGEWRGVSAYMSERVPQLIARPKLPDAAIVFDQKDPDAVATVEFCQAMVRRLAQCRDAGCSGWDDPEQCPPQRLAEGLVRAVRAGKLVDAGNYAMMLWKRAQMARQEQCVPSWLDEARRSDAAQHLGEPVEWDGTGLPPVGTVCEWYVVKDTPWERVAIVANIESMSGARYVLFELEQGSWRWEADPKRLRPIRTPEQRAAKERDEAVAAMLADADAVPFGSEREEDMARALYDAGWRKTEGE